PDRCQAGGGLRWVGSRATWRNPRREDSRRYCAMGNRRGGVNSPSGSRQPFAVVADQQMPGFLVLLDAAETGDTRVLEHVVGVVVIDGRDFADENVAALAPERMPVLVGHQRDALAGRQPELVAGLEVA